MSHSKTEHTLSTPQPVAINESELLQLMQYDCVSFLSFYIGDELTMEVPNMHLDVWAGFVNMVNTANLEGATYELKKLFGVPRGHAKSTLAKLAVILFLKYTDLKFVLYVSKTNPIARNAIRDIILWLSSTQEQQLFGKPQIVKSSETDSLWIVDIWTRTSALEHPIKKRCIFKALGAEQQIRGMLILNMRPQIGILDDIEDLDNTTEALQPKLDEWFMGSLMKCFDPVRSVRIFIGNMIRETTLLARFSKDPEWHPTVFGAIVRNQQTGELESLWAAQNPIEKLLKEYRAYRRIGTGHVWEAEMMNLTQDVIKLKSLGNVVRPEVPDPDSLEAGIIILDPAYTDTKGKHDKAAITVHVKSQGIGIPYCIDTWTGHGDEVQLFDRLLEYSYKWGIYTWGIESAAGQRLFIPIFKLLLANRKMNTNQLVFLLLNSGQKAKHTRINASKILVSSQSYGIAQGQDALELALAEYTEATKVDDIPDSFAYGPIAWQHYGSIINNGSVMQPAMLVQNLLQASNQPTAQYGSQLGYV